jgi:hypothetical protein
MGNATTERRRPQCQRPGVSAPKCRRCGWEKFRHGREWLCANCVTFRLGRIGAPN